MFCYGWLSISLGLLPKAIFCPIKKRNKSKGEEGIHKTDNSKEIEEIRTQKEAIN